MTKYFLMIVLVILFMQIRFSILNRIFPTTAATTFSVQGNVFTLPANEDTLTISITSAPMNRTYVVGGAIGASTANCGGVILVMTADAVIKAIRVGSTGCGAIDGAWWAVTDSNNNVQRGIEAFTGAADKRKNVTISASTLANSWYIINGIMGSSASWNTEHNVGGFLTATTTLRLNMFGTASVNDWVAWQVVTNTHHTVYADSMANNTVDARKYLGATVSEADSARGLLFLVSNIANVTSGGKVSGNASLQKRDTVKVEYSATGTSRTIYWQAILMDDARFYPVSMTYLATQTSVTGAIGTSINTVKGAIFGNGQFGYGGKTASTGSDRSDFRGYFQFETTSEIRGTRATSVFGWTPKPFVMEHD